jgi:hypothetical protein
MATVYKYEETKGDGKTTAGMQFLSASTTNRILFNDPSNTLTNTAYTTAIYYPTDGGHEGSGTGKIVYDNAYHNNRAYIIDNDDRFTWATVLLSATNSNTSNALIALTGVTVTNTTSGAGYTSTPTVVVNANGANVITAFAGTALMHSNGAGVTGVNVTTRGIYAPGTSAPTVTFTGGGYTTQATGTPILSSGTQTSQIILSLSANANNAWGPTERRLRLLEYI